MVMLSTELLDIILESKVHTQEIALEDELSK